jgi:hypothetical protein
MHKQIHAIRIIVVALLFLPSMTSIAQTITGSLNGTVTDPSGATITGAKVTATSTETNQSNTAVTNSSGVYSIRFLQVGHYKVVIEAPGFSAQNFGPITLEADQDVKVDSKMLLEGSQQQVSVDNDLVPLLNTENATLGTTLDATAIDNIPLNGRNFVSLTLFSPGAVSTNPGSLTGTVAITGMVVRNTANGSPSINGNRQQQNNYLLDGIEINETIRDTVGYNPSPDALGQVRIISANAQAEFGNVNGGDVIALLKSGTNAWHGSAFDYMEDYRLDANSWGNKHNAVITPKSSYTQSIFGGTFGGPILKDKFFFFVDYSGGRYHSGGLGSATVATAKMRNGDFSELLDPNIMCGTTGGVCSSNQSLIQLYDPSNNFAPYPDNKGVPINNPVAQYLYSHPDVYPLPNQAPQEGTPATGNYLGVLKTGADNNQGDIKIDWKASSKDQVSIRYSQSDSESTSTNPLAITFPLQPYSLIKGNAINWVRIISASTVNEFRAGFNRIVSMGGFPVDTTGIFGINGNSILGIPGGQSEPGFVAQLFAGTNGSEYTGLGNQGAGTNFTDNTFTYGDDLTVQKGRHAIKVGVQFLRYQENSYYPGNDGVVGNFTFTGNFSSDPAANAASNPNGYGTGGYTLADFNLDRIYSLGVGSLTGDTGQRQWRDAYFVQDDYQLRPNLTLNLGVRYEYDQPIYEVNNKEVGVDLATGTLLFAGKNGASRALYNPSYDNVMPRLGFSYSPARRLVVRGGYGITTFMEGTGTNLRPTINPPFESTYAAIGSAPSATSAGNYFRSENGFSNPATPLSGLTYRIWGNPTLKPEFIGEFSLTTEYQLNNSASFTIGYVGESGQHLATAGLANQLKAPCVINGIVSATPNSSTCAAADPAPYQTLVGQSGSIVVTASNGMMNYNALQASFRQRTAHGLQYTLNYTYGRAMTTNGGFFGVPGTTVGGAYSENYYNNHAEYGPTGQDVRHSVNGTLAYEIPLGRGRRFVSNMNRPLDAAIGGWKLAMTGVSYSGFPITINNSSNNAYTNNNTQRANQLRPLKIVNRSVTHWWGTDPSATGCGLVDNGVCAYASPANGTYGDAANGSERVPGFQQYDLSLSKDFNVIREQKLSFRVDASNVFNLTSLADPVATAQSATFGQITSVRSVPRQLQLSAKYQF